MSRGYSNQRGEPSQRGSRLRGKDVGRATSRTPMITYRVRVGLVLCLAVSGCTKARTVPSRQILTKTVQKDVESMVRALYSGDVATVIDYTHPVILEGLGGRERALAMIDESMSPMLKKGLRIESFTFPRPPEFVEADGGVFAIVPTLLVLDLGGQRVESLNYQLGVLDGDGEKWRYAEGSRIKPDNVRSLFPSFPDGHRFPEIYRKKL